MRLKIIFTPFVIVIAIIVSVWYIWPGIKDIQSKRKEIDANKENLNVILVKKQNSESLISVLDKNKDKEEFISKYLPASKNEDYIISGINYLATDSGLNLTSISIKDEKETETSGQSGQEISTMNAGSASSLPAGSQASGSSSPGQAVSAKSKIRLSDVSVALSGKYENIKIFIDQLYKMEMFNEISSVAISQNKSNGQEDQSGSDVLAATFEIKFGYLPAISARTGNFDIFSKNDFDFGPYSKISDFVARKIPNLDEGQKGKSNPFLP